MTSVADQAPARAWTGDGAVERTVAACIAVAVVPVAVLHVVGSTVVDPVRQTISDYVAVPGGYALLGVSAMTLAAAGAVVAVGLARAGLPRAGPVTVLLATWSAALVLVAVFPTNDPGTPPDVAAAVHRYAGAWVLAALPQAGWLVARRARGAPAWAASAAAMAWLSGTAGLLSLAFLATHAPVLAGEPPHPMVGAVERVLYPVLAVVLLATARAIRYAGTSAERPRTGAPA